MKSKRRRPPKIKVNPSNIYEGCFGGKCEGKCRALYYDTCPVHQKYYIDNSGKRPKKVFIFENSKEIPDGKKKTKQ